MIVSWSIYSSGDDDGGKAGAGGGGSNLEVWHQNKPGLQNGCGRSLAAVGGCGELVETKVVASIL